MAVMLLANVSYRVEGTEVPVGGKSRPGWVPVCVCGAVSHVEVPLALPLLLARMQTRCRRRKRFERMNVN